MQVFYIPPSCKKLGVGANWTTGAHRDGLGYFVSHPSLVSFVAWVMKNSVMALFKSEGKGA